MGLDHLCIHGLSCCDGLISYFCFGDNEKLNMYTQS